VKSSNKVLSPIIYLAPLNSVTTPPNLFCLSFSSGLAIYTYVFKHIYIYTYIYIYIYMYIYIYTYMYLDIHICIFIFIYIYIYIYTYIYMTPPNLFCLSFSSGLAIYANIFKYICIYVHIHIHTFKHKSTFISYKCLMYTATDIYIHI
jgi:hypothetical protein